MKHDRMQEFVRFQMCESGFLLDIEHGQNLMGTRYAFTTIEEVARWFLEQYAQVDRSPKGQDGETRLDRNDESAVANGDAPKEGS